VNRGSQKTMSIAYQPHNDWSGRILHGSYIT
jgi:hypothetical protein